MKITSHLAGKIYGVCSVVSAALMAGAVFEANARGVGAKCTPGMAVPAAVYVFGMALAVAAMLYSSLSVRMRVILGGLGVLGTGWAVLF